MQHITYNEWLPIILGRSFVERNGLATLDSGFSSSYFCEGAFPQQFDPRVANEFATAAFRFGHSLIPPSFFVQFKRRGEQVDAFKLRTAFFQPTEFREDGENEGDFSK
jgi:peroxidase